MTVRFAALASALVLAPALSAQPVALRTTSAESRVRATPAIPDGAISRLDLQLGAAPGFAPGRDDGFLYETTVLMTAESRYLGPLAAQVGGAFGPVDGRDIAGFTVGVGLASGGDAGRSWVMLNAWEQVRSRTIKHGASVSAGFQVPVSGPFGLFGEGRIRINDWRADESPVGLSLWGALGASVTF